MNTPAEKAVQLLAEAGRPLTNSDFREAGVSRLVLSRLSSSGRIERAGPGVYRLPNSGSQHADWAALCLKYPDAVICTLSAAVWHRTTQEMPWSIHAALPHGSRPGAFPVGVTPHIWRTGRFPEAFTLGVETHEIDGVPVRITDPERTLVDMFRFSTANPGARVENAHVETEAFMDCLKKTVHRPEFQADRLDAYVSEAGLERELGPILQAAIHTLADVPFPETAP